LRDERRILQEEVEKRIKAEERLAYEALHDPLTNLPNRRLFANRLAYVLEWNKRHPNDLFAAVYLDFDRFKIVNDSLGHNTGDQLLVEMAGRLKASARATDTVARMGGDEFALLLDAVKSDDEIIRIVKRIQENLTAPFEVNGNFIVTTASIGIVMDLLQYERIDDVMRNADIAMYSAKASGKNCYRVYDGETMDCAGDILKLERDESSAY
jgi:diguanylate cyclase (GGDEF)-like protein